MMEEARERERLESHLDKLRGTRGKKLLDGKSTVAITTAIKQTVEGLDEIDDAAREFERREHSDARERRALERSNVQDELQVVREEIVTATEAAHVAAGEMVKQLRLIFELYESARMKAVALGNKIDVPTTEFEVVSRFSFRLARALSMISPRHRNRLGAVQWSLHGVHPVNEDWVAREKTIVGIERTEINNG